MLKKIINIIILIILLMVTLPVEAISSEVLEIVNTIKTAKEDAIKISSFSLGEEIDVTDLLSIDTRYHNCQNYLVDGYDTVSHYQYCKICGEDSKKYNVQEHSYTETWTGSVTPPEDNSRYWCEYYNKIIKTCNRLWILIYSR